MIIMQIIYDFSNNKPPCKYLRLLKPIIQII
jgi:hypothetical protein